MQLEEIQDGPNRNFIIMWVFQNFIHNVIVKYQGEGVYSIKLRVPFLIATDKFPNYVKLIRVGIQMEMDEWVFRLFTLLFSHNDCLAWVDDTLNTPVLVRSLKVTNIQ